jgi:hypothetical protein
MIDYLVVSFPHSPRHFSAEQQVLDVLKSAHRHLLVVVLRRNEILDRFETLRPHILVATEHAREGEPKRALTGVILFVVPAQVNRVGQLRGVSRAVAELD